MNQKPKTKNIRSEVQDFVETRVCELRTTTTYCSMRCLDRAYYGFI